VSTEVLIEGSAKRALRCEEWIIQVLEGGISDDWNGG
jgi:hypothetical protein